MSCFLFSMITLRGHHLPIFHRYLIAQNSGKDMMKQWNINSIIRSNPDEKYGKGHALQMLDIFARAMVPYEKIHVIDGLDSICEGCRDSDSLVCREFIPYDISAASEDRAVIHYYGLQKRIYSSTTLQKRLLEKQVAP